MPRVSQHMASFARGEITPLAHARVELQDYLLGLQECTNFIPMKYGGLTRLPGTFDLYQTVIQSKPSRLIPFVFSQDQSYALEFQDSKIGIFTTSGRVLNGAVPVTIASPYLEADLWKIQYDTIGDVIYLTCDGYEPRELIRTSDTSWSLDVSDFEKGPWLPMATEGTVLDFNSTQNMFPIRTSNTVPSGSSASMTGGGVSAYMAFDGDHDTQPEPLVKTRVQITYDYGSSASNHRTMIGYLLAAPTDMDLADNCPTSWRVDAQESGSSDWITIDTHNDLSDWLAGEIRIFEIDNETEYRKYRWVFFNNGGANAGTDNTVLPAAIEGLPKTSDQTLVTLNASSVNGINGGAGFSSDDGGRALRVMGEDGIWRYLQIVARVSSTQIYAKVTGPVPLPIDMDGFGLWQLGAWGDEAGWPKVVRRHKGRLGYFNTDTQPRNGWLSVVGDYDSHGVSQPLLADDAIDFSLANGQQDEILWAETNDADLLLGTEGGIRVIGARNTEEVFGPANHEESGRTIIRAGTTLPVWIDRVLIYANKQRDRLYETTFSLDEAGYVASELTMLAEHIFRAKAKEIHFQQSPMNTLWVIFDDGTGAACTYDRQQQVFGVSRVEIPGTSAELISMCILPEAEYDVPMFVTKRTVDGTVQYRVEKMFDPYRDADGSSYDIPVYLMAAARYTGTATTTLTGLDHLENEAVYIFSSSGKELGVVEVSGGSVTLPNSATTTNAIVGLRYTSSFETLRPPNVPQDGAYIGKEMRVISIHADVYETYGLRGGGTNDTDLLTTESDYEEDPNPPSLHTGMLRVPVDEGWGTEQSVKITANTGHPATIRGLLVKLDRGESS